MQKVQDFGKAITAVGASIASMGAKLTTVLGGGLGGIAGFGLKIAADAEKAEIAFGTMLGSAEKAKTVLADLKKFAASTPFEMPEIVDAGRKLIAFGVEAENLIPTLTMLGDVAAGVDVPLGEIAEIFGKAKVQGRLFAEDINQLTGRGIPVISELAKQFGVADSEVKNLVEAGKIGFPQLQKVLQSLTGPGGKFAGLMEAQSKSLSGRFSTLKDNVSQLAGEIGAVLLPAITAAVKVMGNIVNSALEWVKANQATVLSVAKIAAGVVAAVAAVTGLGVAIYGLGGVIGVLVSVAGVAVGTLAGLVGIVRSLAAVVAVARAAVISLATSKVVMRAASAAASVAMLAFRGATVVATVAMAAARVAVTTLTAATVVARTAWAAMTSGLFASIVAFNGVRGALLSVVAGYRLLKIAIVSSAAVAASLRSVVVASTAAFGLLKGGLLAVRSAFFAVATAANVAKVATLAFSAVGAVLGALTSPMLLVGVGLAALGVAAWKAVGGFDGLKAGVGRAFSAIASFGSKVLPLFKAAFAGISDAVMAGDLGLAGEIAIAGLRAVFLQGIASLSATVGGVFGDFIGTFGERIAGGDFAGAWGTAIAGMSAVWASFAAGIVDTFGPAMSAVTDMWHGVQKSIVAGILDLAKRFPKFGKMVLGVDLDAEQKRADKLDPALAEAKRRNLATARERLVKAEANGGKFTDERGGEWDSEGLKVLIADLEKSLAETGQTDVFGDAKKAGQEQIQAAANAAQSAIDNAAKNAEIAADALAKKVAGGSDGSSVAAEEAKKELEALKAKAAAARAEAEKEGGEKKDEPTEVTGETEGDGKEEKTAKEQKGPETQGSFSANAAAMMGGFSTPMDRTAKATEETAKAAKEIAKNTSGKPLKPSKEDEIKKAKDALQKNFEKQNEDPVQRAKDALQKNFQKQNEAPPTSGIEMPITPSKKESPREELLRKRREAYEAEMQRRKDAYAAEMERRRGLRQPKQEKWESQTAEAGGDEAPSEPTDADRMKELQHRADEAKRRGVERIRSASDAFTVGGPPTSRIAKSAEANRQVESDRNAKSEALLASLLEENKRMRAALERGGILIG